MPRLLFIGAGVIAQRHIEHTRRYLADPARGQQPRTLEVHAADPSEPSRASFAKAVPDATPYIDADEMLAMATEESDVVVV